jgi:copper oxidase (laccase) domain-containing protein
VTGRAGGDLNALLPERDDVAWAHQVHGTGVLLVDRPGLAGEADALVTTTPGLRLAVRAADCGTLVLAAPDGAPHPCVAVVHAGWRGTARGVVATAAAAVRRASGAHRVLGWLGPCIGPCCYAFGADDLDAVAAALGPEVRATTSFGHPALDLRAAIASAATRAGVELVGGDGSCTACATGPDGRPVYFSHRARGDSARHGVLACLR